MSEPTPEQLERARKLLARTYAELAALADRWDMPTEASGYRLALIRLPHITNQEVTDETMRVAEAMLQWAHQFGLYTGEL